MSRRDLFHDAVVHALEREGWTVTDDPYYLEYGEQTLQIDVAAEMPIAAERAGRKIAVEIKSFAGKTTMVEFYAAVGQFVTYQDALQAQEPERVLYLAVPDEAFAALFDTVRGRSLQKKLSIFLLVYSSRKETITKWID